MRKIIFSIFLSVLLASKSAFAYIGPGIGLGVIGLIIGVVLSIVIAFAALFWYPFGLLLEKIFGKKINLMHDDEEDEDQNTDADQQD